MSFPRVDGLRSMALGHPGPSRSFLNDCTINGSKRATAGLLSEYIDENEPWEHPGERMVLVDDDDQPVGLIEITRVEETTFSEVTWDFAVAEGEGYADLEDWRTIHRNFWAVDGVEIDDSTPVLCIYFDLVESGYQFEGL